MKPADGIPRYLAVLDGLNEMVFSDSQAKGEFLETVNDYLSRAQNLRLILTGRQDEKRIRAEKLKRFYVEDLSDETVKKALVQPLGQPKEQTDFSRNCQALWKVLHIPFFLSVYQSLSNRGEIKNAGELLERYFFERAESVSGAGDYGERNLSEEKYGDKYYAKGVTVQAVRRFVLQTMLPELGLFMAEQGRFFLREGGSFCIREVGTECSSGRQSRFQTVPCSGLRKRFFCACRAYSEGWNEKMPGNSYRTAGDSCEKRSRYRLISPSALQRLFRGIGGGEPLESHYAPFTGNCRRFVPSVL